MNFPEEFEQFLEVMSFLAKMLVLIEDEAQEYNELLREKASKIEPYLKRAYPVIRELYSTSPDKAHEIFQGATKDIPKQTLQELQTLVSKCSSDEFLSEMFSSEADEKQYFEDELHTLIASLRVFVMNMVANNRYQTSINQLVLNADKGDDDSLFLAIYIDPLVENIPVISERISFAHAIGDNRFLEKLNKSRTASRDDKRHSNNRLNYFLILFYRIGLLEKLTQPQMAEIFMNRLEVYDKDDASLFKYIGRWKKNLKRLDLRQKNQLERSKT